ncbi:hypothetical protein SAMN05216428_11843 [Nitrosospira sp. Nsp11]|nr:hypothetical protein SAMN05216428_11843 [Nitrosospira sp. Nsp11]
MGSKYNAITLVNVKETTRKTSACLTTEGRRFFVQANQATVEIKPNFVSALIQRGALRCTESAS